MYRSILSEMYTLVVGNIGTTFRIAGTWMAIVVALSLGEELTEGSTTSNLFGIASAIASLLSSASIATAWHRFGLLNERPNLIHLRFGRLELRVLGKILLAGLAALPVLIIGVLVIIFIASMSSGMSRETPLPLWGALATFGIVLLYLYFYFRISFIIPGAAVGHRVRMKTSIRLSKGYFLPALAAGLTIEVPVIIACGLLVGLLHLLGLLAGPDGLVLLAIVLSAFEIFFISVTLAAVTVAYRRAIETLWAENPNDPVFVGS